jgi:GNAT superfamily N-acetyltransferase
MSEYAFRRATTADAESMAAVLTEGFATYHEFAPAGWSPPSDVDDVDRLRRVIAADDVWYLVAERDGALVGHVGFLPATRARVPIDDPTLAHFFQLFVLASHWGTGVATRLHAAAIDEARARGFAAMRLFTPAGQARARRFYEREGWTLGAEPEHDERIGFEVAEYRYGLRS